MQSVELPNNNQAWLSGKPAEQSMPCTEHNDRPSSEITKASDQLQLRELSNSSQVPLSDKPAEQPLPCTEINDRPSDENPAASGQMPSSAEEVPVWGMSALWNQPFSPCDSAAVEDELRAEGVPIPPRDAVIIEYSNDDVDCPLEAYERNQLHMSNS